MQAHEIIGYVDLDRISDELLRHLQDVIDRESKRPIDLAVLGLIYGQAAADLEIRWAESKIKKTDAETSRLYASTQMLQRKYNLAG